jgi:hypothetical protein
MSQTESSTKTPAAGATPEASEVKSRGITSNGKYSLTITDPENTMTGGKLTITVDVEDNALKELRASDDQGTLYEVSFQIKKPGTKSSPQPRSVEGSASTDVSVTAGDALTSTAGGGGVNHSGGHGDGKKHGGGKDNDDECQCCTLIGGHFACQPCACPPES